MTRFDDIADRVRGYLKNYADSSLRKSGGKNQYDCPFCGSGTGKDGTGQFTVYTDTDKFYCHKCDNHGDILDLIGRVEGISGAKEQLLRAARIYGISTDGMDDGDSWTEWKPKTAPQPPKKKEEPKEEEPDYSDFLKEARRHITDSACIDYLKRRGISLATASKLGWGFCAEWRSPKAPPTVPTSPRLIMPTSKHSYSARDIRAELNDAQRNFAKMKAGKARIMNLEWALFQVMEPLPEAKPAYIVEGEMDAASIIEVGGEAAALGSAGNVGLFLEELGERKPRATLVLSLDTDKAGREKEDELAARLEEKGIPFYRWNVAESNGGGAYKDANEALVAGRDAFWQRVHDGMAREREELKAFHERKEAKMAEQKIEAVANAAGDDEAAAKREAKKKEFYSMSVSARIPVLLERTREKHKERSLSTGFNALDKALRGGLFPGLFILGGGTSVGKTAFMLQVADTIAKEEHEAAQELEEQGKARHCVLYFSLETGADELLARSASRISRQRYCERAIEYADILDGFRADGFEGAAYGKADATLAECLAEHERYGGFEFIHESIADVTVDDMEQMIKDFIEVTGMKPVVFVDYLQIIPHDEIVSDKRAVDASILALKKIAREYNIPIVAASSINRASYGESVGMASYKESGGIEFTADVLLGLQWKNGAKIDSGMKAHEISVAIGKAESENRRNAAPEITAKILKNRRGEAYKEIELTFEKPYAYFAESESSRVNDIGGRKKWG